ncbi:LiaI-LiaF-like domain-containing protein [Virgibacillus saliphilus]
MVFLIVGFGFLLHQANIIDFRQLLSTWWPLILMMK